MSTLEQKNTDSLEEQERKDSEISKLEAMLLNKADLVQMKTQLESNLVQEQVSRATLTEQIEDLKRESMSLRAKDHEFTQNIREELEGV